MTVRDKDTLKSYFRGGYEPSYLNYVDLIDSIPEGGGEGNPDAMLKEVYDTDDNGIVDQSETSLVTRGLHTAYPMFSAPYGDITASVGGNNEDVTLTIIATPFGTNGVGDIWLVGMEGGGRHMAQLHIDQYNATLMSEGNFFVNSNKVWHQGNDGPASGLDADTLDGLHASDFEVGGLLAGINTGDFLRYNEETEDWEVAVEPIHLKGVVLTPAVTSLVEVVGAVYFDSVIKALMVCTDI